MTSSEILSLLERSGALLRGHFRLSSGLHSGQYFQCARLLSDTTVAERLGRAIAEAVQGRFGKPETVVAPALGGVIIGHETARALGARSIFAERENGRMTLRRGFAVRPGERTVVVEDVFTTGKSTGEVVEVLRGLGASVLGAASIVLRSKVPPRLGVETLSLASLEAESFAEESCPLCAKGVAIVKPGSRPC
ncbi:MAG: orotate phosphoribosyltransferase [Elusimicrobiota bacterium]